MFLLSQLVSWSLAIFLLSHKHSLFLFLAKSLFGHFFFSIQPTFPMMLGVFLNVSVTNSIPSYNRIKYYILYSKQFSKITYVFNKMENWS